MDDTKEPQPQKDNFVDQSYPSGNGLSPVLLVCLTPEQLEEYVKSRIEHMRER